MTENKIHPEDNIELPSFKSFLISGFRMMFAFFDLLLFTIKKYAIVLIIGAVTGGVIGIIRHLLNEKNFNVSMDVEYTMLDKRAYADVLDQFQTLIKTQTYETIASDLKVSTLISRNINRIEGATFDDRPLGKDTSSYPYFKIQLGLKSPYGVDSLETALINYFNELPYLKKIKDDQTRVYTDQLAYADSEKIKIDSLKTAYAHSLTAVKPGAGIYVTMAEPANIYKEAYRVDTMRASLMTWLNSKSKPIVLVKGFRTTKTPQSLSATTSTVLCVFIGAIIALILSLFTEINKRINAG